MGPALPIPQGSSAQAEGLQQGCPFTRGRELGGAASELINP